MQRNRAGDFSAWYDAGETTASRRFHGETEMASDWAPPRPTYHLRIFAISLVLLTLGLLAMLFGVRLPASVPATGIITARDRHEVRAPFAGLVEPGWYEGTIADGNGMSIPVRLDADGNGLTDPAAGPPRILRAEQTATGLQRLIIENRRFHRLASGDILWPGQPIAAVRDEALRQQRLRLDDQIAELDQRGEPAGALKRERDRIVERQASGNCRTPEGADCWLVVEVRAAPLQKVEAGDLLAVIVPADLQTHQPLDLVARLEIDERHWAVITPGAVVRLQSAVYNPRLHGHAEARIERIEPWGQPGEGGRRFSAIAPITQMPAVLPLGSTVQAEISIGSKPVYRIILEH